MENKIRVVLGNLATMPTKSHADDTGYDLYSCEDVMIKSGGFAVINTGVRINLPQYQIFDIQVRGRSGLASQGIFCHPGTIDVGYQGDIMVILYNLSGNHWKVVVGDRIAQLVVGLRANLDMIQVDSFSEETGRGDCGFGSTGR